MMDLLCTGRMDLDLASHTADGHDCLQTAMAAFPSKSHIMAPFGQLFLWEAPPQGAPELMGKPEEGQDGGRSGWW